MTKYKHIPTGIVVDRVTNGYKDRINGNVYPSRVVESGFDWQEIKEPIIPPGIVAFRDKNGTVRKVNTTDYNSWVSGELALGNDIYTIKVDRVEWSVGDWYHHCDGRDHQIKSFEWRGTTWKFNTEEGLNTYMYRYIILGENIFKGKYRKPICQLPDEKGKMVDMFEGDKYFVVAGFDGYQVAEAIMPRDGGFYKIRYATKAAAEKYVMDTKPVYPAGLIDPILECSPEYYAALHEYLKRIRDWNKKMLNA